MIQIDDAGSGSLIGGTCIGVLRKETMEYYYDFIPIELYRNPSFYRKEYLEYVIKIINPIFKKLCVSKKEKIELCRGYMFDNLRQWLTKEGYEYTSCKIEEPLQDIIEKTFEEYCLKLGLYENCIRFNKYPFHFHTILKWVYADHENRKLLCKTGWKSWIKYGNLDVIEDEIIISKNNIICLKCGQSIPKGIKAKTIIYTTNKKTILFLHSNC